jgi:hypothetical protein
MSEDKPKTTKDQEERQQAEVVADLCYRFVKPLLQNLHCKLDRRIVQTLLDLLIMIVIHRHRNHGLLLSELGGYLLDGEHAPAGTKRISNLLGHPGCQARPSPSISRSKLIKHSTSARARRMMSL